MIRLILFCFVLFTAQMADAQSSQYDVRLRLKKVDCANRKALIGVDIRAHAGTSTFDMGNANFRFSYDPRVIKNPLIASQDNFSSTGATAAESYGSQTLNGSVERSIKGIVSLNIHYIGSGNTATQVAADWMPVTTLQFDLASLTGAEQTLLKWQNHTTFPITGLSEIVHAKQHTLSGYESRAVAASGVFKGLQLQSLTELCNGNPDQSGRELFIPDGFSPNGDGVNDLFVITNLDGLKASVSVFDQNGSVLFRSDDYQNNWNGSYNNQLLPAGTYFYAVQLSDGRKFTKGLTISR